MERNPRNKKPTKKKKSPLPYEAVTWENLKMQGDSMYILLTKNGKIAPPLPFGQLPSVITNLKCDEFLGQLWKAKRIRLDMPPELAPWILARMTVALTWINTSIAHGGKPPTAKTIEDALFDLTVKEWNECLFLLWTGFVPTTDGKSARLKVANFGKGLDTKSFSGN